jgi:XTP/dITP diphosphohydrolase
VTGTLAASGPIVIATRNAGKLRELRALFATLGTNILDLDGAGIPLDEDAEASLEQFATFEENALAKARYFARLAGGLPVAADDSGIEVRALGGAPGVRSRRYAGAVGSAAEVDAANTARLLQALQGHADRNARFVCAAAYVDGARELVCRGEVVGRVADAPVGCGGFGYDPVFLSDELGRSFGEATSDEKEQVSHRGRAFRALAQRLAAIQLEGG